MKAPSDRLPVSFWSYVALGGDGRSTLQVKGGRNRRAKTQRAQMARSMSLMLLLGVRYGGSLAFLFAAVQFVAASIRGNVGACFGRRPKFLSYGNLSL